MRICVGMGGLIYLYVLLHFIAMLLRVLTILMAVTVAPEIHVIINDEFVWLKTAGHLPIPLSF